MVAMSSNPRRSEPLDMQPWITAYASGDRAAGDKLCQELSRPLRVAAGQFLGDDNPDVDDIVQESLLAILQYIRKGRGFSGSLVRFGVTVARNRCRNYLNWRARHPGIPLEPLADWLANPERSPLDVLLEEEKLHLLQEVLDRMSGDCQALLRAFYLEGISVEEIRHRFGLQTVQGVYYRRARCLEHAAEFLKERVSGCSTPQEEARRSTHPGRAEGTNGP